MANVCSSGAPLAVVCSLERKGCGSTQRQPESVTARWFARCTRPGNGPNAGNGPSVTSGMHSSSDAVARVAVAAAVVMAAVAQQWHVLMHMHQ